MTAPNAKRSMFSDNAFIALVDMRANILSIEDFVGGFTFEIFEREMKTRYASIWALEIICEAGRRLPADLTDRHPETWKKLQDGDHKNRQKDDGVGARLLWKIAVEDIPPLLVIVEAELAVAKRDGGRPERT